MLENLKYHDNCVRESQLFEYIRKEISKYLEEYVRKTQISR